jgi:nucleotide-binding universal stress UspA family protein
MMAAAPLVLVVGVDGSQASLRAVRHALRLSLEAPCELYLCNVQPAMTYAETLLAGNSRLVEHWSGSPGRERLREAQDAVEAAGCAAFAEILHGDPAEEIARQAREVRADLILVGTRGLNPAQELVLGSVARRLTELASCPVVTTR